MINPETVSESFIKWMEDNGYGTFETNIYEGDIPDTAPDNAYWVVSAGGDVTGKLVTAQSTQQFVTQINYRNISRKAVGRTLFALANKVNARREFNIDGFEIFSIEASLPEDNDRDAENRRQGSVTVLIEIYKSYVS